MLCIRYKGAKQMNIYNAKITFTTHDIGREANSKEEYIESVKMQFLEENNIDLRDDEITILEEQDNDNLWKYY